MADKLGSQNEIKVPSGEEGRAADLGLLRDLFLEEAEKHLARILDAQKSLARAAEVSLEVSPEVVDTLFRHLHTLKGSAGSVGFEAVARSAHELEELCAEIRKGQLAPTLGILERLEDGVGEIRALLASARLVVPPKRDAFPTGESPLAPDPEDRRRVAERRAVADRRSSTDGFLRIEMERLDALLAGVGDTVMVKTRFDRRAQEAQGILRDLASARKGLRTIAKDLAHVAQVGGEDVSHLLDRMAEVDVKFSDAISYLDRTTRSLSADADSLSKTSADLENQLHRARMVPLEWGFSRLGSAVRELERGSHRQVELTALGGEIELDKSLVDQLVDPLLHLLRNAIAHGIEAPELRAARQKPSHGRITITATQESDFIRITFEDDGGGIDRAAVHRVLETQGRLKPGEDLPDPALFAYLFEPGFSTRHKTDALAGRGLGLNIVKRALSRLGGEIQLESEPGVKTRFHLTLPRAGAITKGVLFKLGGQVYAIPAMHVVQILPVGHNVLSGTARSSTESGEIPTISGNLLPILKLHAILGVELPPGRKAAAIHVRYAGRNFLLTCDKVIGPRTIVIRPPGPLLGLVSLYAGVTASGAGKAQVVLDLGVLSEYLDRPTTPTLAPRRGQPRILVVDYSRLGRDALAQLLHAAGYQVVTAEDGYEAWEILDERRFDAVVTGLEMPRVDGFQLITRIRRDPTLAGLPILVLTSRTAKTNRDRALAAGADLFVPKTRNRKSLLEAVAACLNSSRK